MAEEESGYKWWIRYVAVPLLTGGGVIAVIVATYFHRPEPTTQPATPPTAEIPLPPGQPTPGTAQTTTSEVERIASIGATAFLSGDIDKVVALSDTPFFLLRGVSSTEQELRSRYANVMADMSRSFKEAGEIRSITVRTVREIQQSSSGQMKQIQLANTMSLSADDLVVSVLFKMQYRTNEDEMIVLVRRLNNKYKIVGVYLS
jgi:hypothetical protein